SPGHRANILQSMFTQVGISVKASPSGVLYFTEEFGAPAAGAVNVIGGVPTTPITPLPPPPPPLPTTLTPASGSALQPAQHLYAVGTKGGKTATVTGYDASTGRQVFVVRPFNSFAGGVHVATGDINGDGYDDVVVA